MHTERFEGENFISAAGRNTRQLSAVAFTASAFDYPRVSGKVKKSLSLSAYFSL